MVTPIEIAIILSPEQIRKLMDGETASFDSGLRLAGVLPVHIIIRKGETT